MLRKAKDVPLTDRIRNEELSGKLPKVTHKIRERRLGLAGHCIRYSDLEVCDLILWEPAKEDQAEGVRG